MPYKIIKNGIKSYQVINSETGKIHAKHTSLQKAKSQIRLLSTFENPRGDGLFNTVKNLIYGRNDYSSKIKNLLSQIDNQTINSIIIGRTPLQTATRVTLNVLSNQNYDKLFHLFILVNNKIKIEKNEVINIVENNTIPNGTETYIIKNIPNNLTIKSLLDNTKNYMGEKYFKYSGSSNNCQDYILSILKSNNINEGHEFVKQDTESIFKNNPNLRKFVNTITNVAGRFDVLKSGGSLSNATFGFKIHLNGLSNGLYSDEIKHILNSHNYIINGVYSKDKLPKKITNGWYIINLQNSDNGNGTHWCVFAYHNGNIFYYDAFGFACPIEVMQHCKNNLYFSSNQDQNLKSSCCGWFCIACIIFNYDINDIQNTFKKFINLFPNDTRENDVILYEYLHKKRIIK